MADTTCLVTGGAGFIGSNLTDRLVQRGHAVRIVDNLSTGDRENVAHLADRIDFIVGDLCDRDVCEAAVQDIDVVFHVAALPSVPRSIADPWGSHDANVNSTVRLLQASHAAKVSRIVYSSSSSVYGDTPILPKIEDAEPLPRSPYAASKLASEQYVLAFARAGLVPGIALRYFNVFGPRQSPTSAYAAVVPSFLHAALRGTPATLYGDGTQTRDFTFIDNVIDANLRAATGDVRTTSGVVVNAGAGKRTSLRELLALVERVTERSVHVETRPPRQGDVRDSLASLERAQEVLGYMPTVDLVEGLRLTWEWMRNGARV